MDGISRVIEVDGTVDEDRCLHLEGPLPIEGPSRVRVIVLVPDDPEIEEGQWLRAAATNSAFDFLDDPAEDVYTAADGEPFHDEG